MKAPEQIGSFVAKDQLGEEFDLDKELTKGPVVVFFYPKASSPVCTQQSCAFRDTKSEFSELGATVVGVSADSGKAQTKFDESNDLGIRLLTDTGQIASEFGIARRFKLPAKRATFVVGEGRAVLGEYYSELNGPGHADWALEFLRQTKG